MYNQDLYEQVLNKKHHAYRKPFVMERDLTDPSVPPVRRMAMRLQDVLAQETPVILPGQSLVFIRTVTDVPSIFGTDEWNRITADHFIHELGYISNICGNFAPVIAEGLEAVRKKAVKRLEQAKAENDREGIDFLEALCIELDAVEDLADRYRAEAQKQGNEKVVRILDQVPRNGARHYDEALQFFRILHYTLWAEGEYHNTVGRFDQFAYPYLKADMEAGLLDRPQAEALTEEFFMSFNWDNDKYVGVQLGDNGQAMMLGGVDENGNDVYNMLSEICLRTSCELKLIDPKINLRVSSQTPIERFREGTRLTKAGLGFPQYSNDDKVIPALVKMGYDIKDARNYSVAACWEFLIPGCGMEIPNIAAFSYPLMVDRAMPKLPECKTFDEFLSLVHQNMRDRVNEIEQQVKNLYPVPAPFYSILMDGCVERARDISHGNRYNNFGIHGTGLATAADALSAIRNHVFEQKDVSAEAMVDAVQKDFAGYEELLHTLRYKDAKMGDDDPAVDGIAADLMRTFASAAEGKRNERGGIFRVGTGSAMFYLWHANEIGASADGRRKGEPFGTNFSPSLFVRSKGPFSVIRSFAQMPTENVMNGGPLTMEFHSSVFDTDEGIERVAALVKAFVDLGGHQLQLNSINRDRLLDAQKHPENYANLIVRIWGWSAYFVELDKEYQDHLIARQEFHD